MNADGIIANAGTPSVNDTMNEGRGSTVESLNGLRAVVDTIARGDSWTYTVFLVDEAVIVSISFSDPDDIALAHQIIDTIGAAPSGMVGSTSTVGADPAEAGSRPSPDEFDATRARPDAIDFCAAIDEFRHSGLVDADTGSVDANALPYFDRMLAAAPQDLAEAPATIRAWLTEGAPQPAPSSVEKAMQQATQEWLNACEGGATVVTSAPQPR
jgi:hypothetical protein